MILTEPSCAHTKAMMPKSRKKVAVNQDFLFIVLAQTKIQWIHRCRRNRREVAETALRRRWRAAPADRAPGCRWFVSDARCRWNLHDGWGKSQRRARPYRCPGPHRLAAQVCG